MSFTVTVFIYAILPTLVYLAIGLYILNLEQKKGPGYKSLAVIFFISVPSLILIGATLTFSMNYMTGRYEAGTRAPGYELYKFLVLKDIIPRSSQSIKEKEQIKVVEKKEETIKEAIKPKINQVSVADENEFEVIIENLSVGENLSYDLSNKNDEEKITATIKKDERDRETINQGKVKYVSTNFEYKVLDKYNNRTTYRKSISDKYPLFKIYNYEQNVSNYYAYLENIDENFTSFELFGKSKFGLINVNRLYEDNTILIGLNKSVPEIIRETKLFFKKNVDNKILSEDEAEKIAKDKVLSQINYISFIDNTLLYSLTPEEKEKMPPYSVKKKEFRENSVIYYERGNKKNTENSDFIGLCNNQDKFNNFYKNNYKEKDCLELFYSILDDKIETDYIDKIQGLEEKLVSSLSSPLDEKLKTDEKYYALVIGNNNYKYLEKLDAAENDAVVIADVLKNKYGFEVDLLLNADQETTVDTLFNITDKLKNNDNLLIYYAGHGELDKAENRGYWLPVDASYEKRSKWISNQTIVDRIKATKAKHVLLVADSCFSGTLMRSGTNLQNQEPIDEKYIERLKNKKTRLVITSGGNEPVVDSVGGDHSLFALKFIDTLKNSENVINSQILFENIRRYVVANADQTPERAQVHKTGHDGGDFLFFPK